MLYSYFENRTLKITATSPSGQRVKRNHADVRWASLWKYLLSKLSQKMPFCFNTVYGKELCNVMSFLLNLFAENCIIKHPVNAYVAWCGQSDIGKQYSRGVYVSLQLKVPLKWNTSGSLLLTWNILNLSMDILYPLSSVGWNYSSIPKLQCAKIVTSQ